jgi:hypothetical protein
VEALQVVLAFSPQTFALASRVNPSSPEAIMGQGAPSRASPRVPERWWRVVGFQSDVFFSCKLMSPIKLQTTIIYWYYIALIHQQTARFI